MIKFRKVTGMLLTAFLLISAGCTALHSKLEKPRLNITNIEVKDATLFEQRYALGLRIKNPNPVDLPITGIHYSLHLAGNEFADGVSAEPFTVPAYGETEFEVTMNTSLFGTFKQVIRMLRDKGRTMDYRIAGKLQVDLPLVKTLTFKEEGKVDLLP